MPLQKTPSKGYWGCETLTNKAIWVIFISFMVSGGTLLGEGYHLRDGPHACFRSLSSCNGNFTGGTCAPWTVCNGTILSNGTCTSFNTVYCEDEERPYMNPELTAGIILLVIGVLFPIAFFFSKAPVDPNEDDGEYLPVAKAPLNQAPSQQPLRA